jgi:hypothetical protein
MKKMVILVLAIAACSCKKSNDPLAKYNLQRMNGMHQWRVSSYYTATGYSSLTGSYYPYDTTLYTAYAFSIQVQGNTVAGLPFQSANDSLVIFSNQVIQGPYNSSTLFYNYRANTITEVSSVYITGQLAAVVTSVTP